MTAPARTAAPAAVEAVEARVYGGYLLAQAVGGVLLWIGIATWPAFRAGFELIDDHREVTNAFGAPDLILIVVGSALGGWAVLRGRRWAVPVVWCTAGCVLYPTVYLVAFVATAGGKGAVGLGVMFLVSTAMTWVSYQIWRLAR